MFCRIFASGKEHIIARLKVFLHKRPEIRFAFLHGSFTDELPCRDIDIAIFFLTPDSTRKLFLI
ncbi:MAG: hypothetical protein HPY89_01910 [Pelotomaculum sp.]|nr:hypothetical protein [Pelotomaculum sp.]